MRACRLSADEDGLLCGLELTRSWSEFKKHRRSEGETAAAEVGNEDTE